MREQPRQIYTSVRTDDGATSASSARTIVVTVLALAAVVVAVLSFV